MRFTKFMMRFVMMAALQRWAGIVADHAPVRVARVEARLFQRLDSLPAYIQWAFQLLSCYLYLRIWWKFLKPSYALTTDESLTVYGFCHNASIGAVRDYLRFAETLLKLYWMDEGEGA